MTDADRFPTPEELLDQERRLQAFLSGQETLGPPLAGWARFRKTYGDGSEQRRPDEERPGQVDAAEQAAADRAD